MPRILTDASPSWGEVVSCIDCDAPVLWPIMRCYRCFSLRILRSIVHERILDEEDDHVKKVP